MQPEAGEEAPDLAPLLLAGGEPAGARRRSARGPGCCGSRGGGRPPRRRRSRSRSRTATTGRRPRGVADVVAAPAWRRTRSAPAARRCRPGARSVPSSSLTRAVRTRTGDRSGSSPRDVDRSRGDGGAADVGGQLAEPGGRQVDDLRVAALLEAGRRLGAQAEPARGAADRRGIEPGHLEQHLGGGRRRSRTTAPPMIPAMPTGVSSASQISRSSAVSVRSTSSRVTSVSPARGPPDPQPAARDLGQVVGMVRLTELEHHVVRDVDQRVDRAHAEMGQPLLHPVRRRRRR